jgi:hypothetical protein
VEASRIADRHLGFSGGKLGNIGERTTVWNETMEWYSPVINSYLDGMDAVVDAFNESLVTVKDQVPKELQSRFDEILEGKDFSAIAEGNVDLGLEDAAPWIEKRMTEYANKLEMTIKEGMVQVYAESIPLKSSAVNQFVAANYFDEQDKPIERSKALDMSMESVLSVIDWYNGVRAAVGQMLGSKTDKISSYQKDMDAIKEIAKKEAIPINSTPLIGFAIGR